MILIWIKRGIGLGEVKFGSRSKKIIFAFFGYVCIIFQMTISLMKYPTKASNIGIFDKNY